MKKYINKQNQSTNELEDDMESLRVKKIQIKMNSHN